MATKACEAFQVDLPDLLYGELDAERRQASDSHAAACEGCRGLLDELRAIRAAQAEFAPPPLLTSRIKLAARDALLQPNQPPRLGGAGGTLHVVGTALLAACVGMVAFGLGIAYERGGGPDAPARTAETPPSPAPQVLVREPQPEWLVEISKKPPQQPGAAVPRGAPEEWQRVLKQNGEARLARGQFGSAREFFLSAVDLAPKGRLAAEARVGAAEALLRAGDRAGALEELREVRVKVMAGALYGSAPLLQRISELMDEADPPPEVSEAPPPAEDKATGSERGE
jgi:hypothetical protein